MTVFLLNFLASLMQLAQGAFWVKQTSKDAFRTIPVHTSDYNLLGMQWRHQIYFDKCMPMGCSSSCHTFELFTPHQSYCSPSRWCFHDLCFSWNKALTAYSAYEAKFVFTYFWNIPFEIHHSKVSCLGLKLTILQALKVVLFELRGQNTTWQAADVILVPEDQFSMAESKEGKRQWGWYCVAGAPNQQSSHRASPRTSSPKIQLSEAYGFNLSTDIDKTFRIPHLHACHFVLPIWIVLLEKPGHTQWHGGPRS